MRVFIGLYEIAGYYSGLKKGFDEIGVRADFVTLQDHRFRYHDNDLSNPWIRLVKHARLAAMRPAPLPLKVLRAAAFRALLLPLFVWALATHDVFVFASISTFFNFKELPILKLFGKKIIYVFQGGDTRPPYVCGGFVLVFDDWTAERWIDFTRRRKEALRKIERYADVLVADLPFAQLAERACVSYLKLGIPFCLNVGGDALRGGEARQNGSGGRRAIRILHCPSDERVKGTDRIRRAVESLKAKGHALEYVELTGKPNRVVLEEVTRSDFVIDQLYSDTPMAGLATEAAFLGKPAVVGGYAAELIKRTLGADALPPSVFCHPDEIERAIESLVIDEQFRRELGERARQYVEENWAPAKVARRYLRLIAGDVPAEWGFSPRESRNVHGCGLPEEKAREMVRAVIERGGREALQLSDKPELEAMFVEFAYSQQGGAHAAAATGREC
jgi:glycosyltransferase involved in cell wall biosynthesis